MTFKQTISWALIGLVVIIGIVYMSNPESKQQQWQQFADKDRHVLILDYGNGKDRKFSSAAVSSIRAWDLLQQASANSHVEVKIENGFVPVAIDGIENNENHQWKLYVNGVKQTARPFEVMVQKGDVTAFLYE